MTTSKPLTAEEISTIRKHASSRTDFVLMAEDGLRHLIQVDLPRCLDAIEAQQKEIDYLNQANNAQMGRIYDIESLLKQAEEMANSYAEKEKMNEKLLKTIIGEAKTASEIAMYLTCLPTIAQNFLKSLAKFRSTEGGGG